MTSDTELVERLRAERDEALAAAYDQPHGPSSRILWSTRYGEVLDDAKEAQAALSAANAEVERLRELAHDVEHDGSLRPWRERYTELLSEYHHDLARAALSREA